MGFRTSISEVDEFNEEDEIISNDFNDSLAPMRKEMVRALFLHIPAFIAA